MMFNRTDFGIMKAFIFFIVFYWSSQALPVSEPRRDPVMTKLYSLVILYKGDSAAHILKVQC